MAPCTAPSGSTHADLSTARARGARARHAAARAAQRRTPRRTPPPPPLPPPLSPHLRLHRPAARRAGTAGRARVVERGPECGGREERGDVCGGALEEVAEGAEGGDAEAGMAVRGALVEFVGLGARGGRLGDARGALRGWRGRGRGGGGLISAQSASGRISVRARNAGAAGARSAVAAAAATARSTSWAARARRRRRWRWPPRSVGRRAAGFGGGRRARSQSAAGCGGPRAAGGQAGGAGTMSSSVYTTASSLPSHRSTHPLRSSSSARTFVAGAFFPRLRSTTSSSGGSLCASPTVSSGSANAADGFTGHLLPRRARPVFLALRLARTGSA
ncbi:hypothetical protein FB451DRAFT_1363846 [Mycena latifolia]|nr:hypothetical protein FB451DRAFT_1363846 [Mycena latifolia]